MVICEMKVSIFHVNGIRNWYSTANKIVEEANVSADTALKI